MCLTLLDPEQPNQDFPPSQKALKDPNGLLAVGGCLSSTRLINAYRHGIFPWYNQEEPILWWSPDPRLVLFPEQLIVSQSLRKTLKKQKFTVTIDRAFKQVISACAQPRKVESNTWITNDIEHAYIELHRLGIAHSAETWLDDALVGGLSGVAIGQVFFGESMFHTATDASKVAFATLVEKLKNWDYHLIDCQVHSSHLANLGAVNINRKKFNSLINQYCEQPAETYAWGKN